MKTSNKIVKSLNQRLSRLRRYFPNQVLWLLVLNFLYFPISQILGWVEPFWAARAATPYAHWDLLVCLILSFSFSFLLLVAPMGWSSYLCGETWELPDIWQWARVFSISLLWSIVSVSFAHFTGEFVGSFQVFDYIVVAVIPATIAAVYFFKTQEFVGTTLFVGTCLFFGVFLVGDVLGPFPTFIKYKILNQAVYALRFTLCLSSLVVVLVQKRNWEILEEGFSAA